jgi:hypothetical protein
MLKFSGSSCVYQVQGKCYDDVNIVRYSELGTALP